MATIISILLFIVFLFVSSIHFYWALGGHWGSLAVFPTKDDKAPAIKPGKIPTLIVAVGLLAFGLFYLVKCGLITIRLPLWLDKYGLRIIACIFILRAVGEFNYIGFFKKYKNTRFGQNDTKYYSPLCLLIGILTIILLLNK